MRYEIINEKKRLMGITNAQLSEMTGVTLSTLDKITSGANQNPKLGTLKAIAKAINCTLDDFDDIAVNSLSSAALTLARKYDALDDHGKMVLDSIADLETQRLAVPDRLLAQLLLDMLELVVKVPVDLQEFLVRVGVCITELDFGFQLGNPGVLLRLVPVHRHVLVADLLATAEQICKTSVERPSSRTDDTGREAGVADASACVFSRHDSYLLMFFRRALPVSLSSHFRNSAGGNHVASVYILWAIKKRPGPKPRFLK